MWIFSLLPALLLRLNFPAPSLHNLASVVIEAERAFFKASVNKDIVYYAIEYLPQTHLQIRDSFSAEARRDKSRNREMVVFNDKVTAANSAVLNWEGMFYRLESAIHDSAIEIKDRPEYLESMSTIKLKLSSLEKQIRSAEIETLSLIAKSFTYFEDDLCGGEKVVGPLREAIGLIAEPQIVPHRGRFQTLHPRHLLKVRAASELHTKIYDDYAAHKNTEMKLRTSFFELFSLIVQFLTLSATRSIDENE